MRRIRNGREEMTLPAYRAAHRLTQRALARKLGISIRSLQNYEQGRRKPKGLAKRMLDLLLSN